MAIEIDMRRTTTRPDEVRISLYEDETSLLMTLDESTELALDMLELAYSVRAGVPVPIFSLHTGKQALSNAYKPTSRVYSVAESSGLGVAVHLKELRRIGRRYSWEADDTLTLARDTAHVLGQRLVTAARESEERLYEGGWRPKKAMLR
jgi:hypothetical protein